VSVMQAAWKVAVEHGHKSLGSNSSKWLPQRGAEQVLSLEALARWGLSSSAYFRDHLTGFLPARTAAV
jgi:hypothetical protein